MQTKPHLFCLAAFWFCFAFEVFRTQVNHVSTLCKFGPSINRALHENKSFLIFRLDQGRPNLDRKITYGNSNGLSAQSILYTVHYAYSICNK